MLILCYLKKGICIETVTSIIDFENLSFQRHYYWPGLETLKEVSQRYSINYSRNEVLQVLSQVEANCPERIERVFVVKGIFTKT